MEQPSEGLRVGLFLGQPVASSFGASGLGFRVWGLGFGVWGFGFRVWGFGFRVWAFGFTKFRIELRVWVQVLRFGMPWALIFGT